MKTIESRKRVFQTLPVVPVVALVAANHGRSVVLSAAGGTNPNLIAELVLCGAKNTREATFKLRSTDCFFLPPIRARSQKENRCVINV